MLKHAEEGVLDATFERVVHQYRERIRWQLFIFRLSLSQQASKAQSTEPPPPPSARDREPAMGTEAAKTGILCRCMRSRVLKRTFWKPLSFLFISKRIKMCYLLSNNGR